MPLPRRHFYEEDLLDAEYRFWPKVNKTSTCWLWEAATNSGGYGQFGVRGRGNTITAHTYSFFLATGTIPYGKTLDHLCRVRNCVRPDHLEVVTNRENILRGISPIAIGARQTHCPQGHEHSPANTAYRPSRPTERICRPCDLMKKKEYRRKRRVELQNPRLTEAKVVDSKT